MRNDFLLNAPSKVAAAITSLLLIAAIALYDFHEAGAVPMHGLPRSDQPYLGVQFVFIPVSSRKINLAGSTSFIHSSHSERAS